MSVAPNELRQHFDRELTEKQFQQAVVNLARATGWRMYHTFRADHSPAGFPDLVLVKPPRLVFAELKTEKGKTTPDQEAWLADLRSVGMGLADEGLSERGHVDAYCWRPSDWPEIERVLTGREIA